MKRSRVFLGVTTLCLAAAGIVAAKSTKGNDSGFYYTAPGVAHCKAAVSTCQINPQGTVTCKTVSSGAKPYFTNSICTKPLRYTNL